MAVVESLIVGKDKEVRGENVRVITTGKAVHLSRPVQKLFPIEIRTGTSEIWDVPKENRYRATKARCSLPFSSVGCGLEDLCETSRTTKLRYVCAYLDSNRVMRGGSVGKHIARYTTQRPLP